MAVPHYSPGYAGWDVADQNRLFELIDPRHDAAVPGAARSAAQRNAPAEEIAAGGVWPRRPHGGSARPRAHLVPCESCPFHPAGTAARPTGPRRSRRPLAGRRVERRPGGGLPPATAGALPHQSARAPQVGRRARPARAAAPTARSRRAFASTAPRARIWANPWRSTMSWCSGRRRTAAPSCRPTAGPRPATGATPRCALI